MLNLDYDELYEAAEEKIHDKTVSTKMKEALIKLQIGMLAVQVCEFSEKLSEKKDVPEV